MNIESIIVGLLGVAAVWYIVKSHLPTNKCNQDCNQGRNCDCKGK